MRCRGRVMPLQDVGLHCPEKYLSSFPKTLWSIKDESQPLSSLLSLASAMETATNIYAGQTLVLCADCLLLWRSLDHKERWRFVTMVQAKFTLLCPRPQTSTTAARVQVWRKASFVLRCPCPPAHLPVKTWMPLEQHSSQPPHVYRAFISTPVQRQSRGGVQNVCSYLTRLVGLKKRFVKSELESISFFPENRYHWSVPTLSVIFLPMVNQWKRWKFQSPS